jgi:hypothetical protein
MDTDTPWIRGYRLSYSQHVHTVFGRQLGDSYCFGIQAAWIRAGYQLDTLGYGFCACITM